MTSESSSPATAAQKAVLTKAFMRAAQLLALSRTDLSQVIGVSPASLSRIYNQTAFLSPRTKEGELAALLIRIYRSIDSQLGGNEELCRAWLHSPNQHLGAVPAELLKTITGITHVANYLDAMRAKV